MSVLNLGAGLSTFVGPAVVGLFIGSHGASGVIWIFTGLYLFSAVLMKFVTLSPEQTETQARMVAIKNSINPAQLSIFNPN